MRNGDAHIHARKLRPADEASLALASKGLFQIKAAQHRKSRHTNHTANYLRQIRRRTQCEHKWDVSFHQHFLERISSHLPSPSIATCQRLSRALQFAGAPCCQWLRPWRYLSLKALTAQILTPQHPITAHLEIRTHAVSHCALHEMACMPRSSSIPSCYLPIWRFPKMGDPSKPRVSTLKWSKFG